MEADDADKLFRPEIMDYIKFYVESDTQTERDMLFPSVEAIITNAINDGVCIEIVLHYITCALEYMKIHEEINIAKLFPDILKMVSILYSNKQYARKITQQIIVMISKTNLFIKKSL